MTFSVQSENGKIYITLEIEELNRLIECIKKSEVKSEIELRQLTGWTDLLQDAYQELRMQLELKSLEQNLHEKTSHS